MIRRPTRWLVGLVLALSMVFLFSSVAQAAIPPYLWLKINGNLTEGGVNVPGREKSSEILYFEQAIRMVEGKPQFTLTFEKPIDKVSPDITKAILEQLPVEAKFNFYMIDDTGTELPYYTINVVGQLASTVILSPHIKEVANERKIHTERVTMVIRSISWTFLPEKETVSSGSIRTIQ